MKALVGAFNQEKALVGAFSVIVQPAVEPMEHYTALHEPDEGEQGEDVADRDPGGAGRHSHGGDVIITLSHSLSHSHCWTRMSRSEYEDSQLIVNGVSPHTALQCYVSLSFNWLNAK